MDILERLIDDDDERGRAEQIQAVRMLLSHPDNARTSNDRGEIVWTRPPHRTAENLEVVLTEDPWFRYRLCKNEFTGGIEWEGEPICDEDLTAIRLAISRTYSLRVGLSVVHEIVAFVAKRLGRHPVREYLEALRWDGKHRVDKLLHTYARCVDSPLHDVLSRRFLVSAVARILDPGCKVDTVLILAGPQGYGKSTFFRTLAGDDWFRDDTLDLRNKDATMQLRGAWLYELAELASTRVRDAETVKAFISRPIDHYRPPYGRNVVQQKRQSIFVGTTNEPSFLNDPTGARRFWPAEVRGLVNTMQLEHDRDQLWAEAVTLYRARERWWLDLNESNLLADAQEQYQHEDPWLPKVARWLDLPDTPSEGFTVETLLNGAIKKDDDRQTKADEMRLGGILTALGYVKRRTRTDGARAWRWYPTSVD
jgi:predicted P-loop ATPase